MIDPVQVNQILTNLSLNSRDAIQYSGEIIIKTKKVLAKDKDFSKEGKPLPESFVVLSISDSGIGMTKDVVKHIFEPFYTTKEVGTGTGLGLSMVYGIVEQNNGYLEVESDLGRGTVLNLYLPLYPAAEISALEHQDSGNTTKENRTLLLIEDNESVLGLTKAMLERLGYKVFGASNVNDSLAIFSRYHEEIDLIVIDAVMPVMNGRTLIDVMLNCKPDQNYLYMSGYDRQMITELGVVDDSDRFIRKPFTMAELANQLVLAMKPQVTA